MLAITHTITGAAVGALMPNVPLALAGGFVIHLLLDTFTHWNFFPGKHRPLWLWAILDLGLGLFVTWLFIGSRMFSPPILAGIVGGNLPDVLTMGSLLVRVADPWFTPFHRRLQQETFSLRRGLPSQLVSAAIAIGILLWT